MKGFSDVLLSLLSFQGPHTSGNLESRNKIRSFSNKQTGSQVHAWDDNYNNRSRIKTSRDDDKRCIFYCCRFVGLQHYKNNAASLIKRERKIGGPLGCRLQGTATSGFTLIELLVVVLIIGVLSAVALPQYNKAVEKSRATEALTMIRAAIQAEEAYYLANGEYTDDMEALDISIPSTDNFYLESLADGDEDDSRIQIYNERTGMRSWWIYYYKNKTLNCQVEKEEPSGSLARSVCKSFSSKEVTCLEPEYDCYVMN
ncbi:type IV pilin protein [Candidatus Avelusimicrobium stercoris]|uniref:type IV pilin protein n=1 Tax=Candidatus Avelusimicrobium stercoris TaxID=1947924 RepID=UPI003D11CCCA